MNFNNWRGLAWATILVAWLWILIVPEFLSWRGRYPITLNSAGIGWMIGLGVLTCFLAISLYKSTIEQNERIE